MAIDDLVDIVGRSTIETVLRLSAEQLAGEPPQEYILFQPTEGLEFITELELQQIAREPCRVLPQSGKTGENPIETRVEAQQMLIHVYLQNGNSSRDRSIDPNTPDVV